MNECHELLVAARAVAMYLTLSTDLYTNDLVYHTPAQSLREAATEIEKKDEAIKKFRLALEHCKEKTFP